MSATRTPLLLYLGETLAHDLKDYLRAYSIWSIPLEQLQVWANEINKEWKKGKEFYWQYMYDLPLKARQYQYQNSFKKKKIDELNAIVLIKKEKSQPLIEAIKPKEVINEKKKEWNKRPSTWTRSDNHLRESILRLKNKCEIQNGCILTFEQAAWIYETPKKRKVYQKQKKTIYAYLKDELIGTYSSISECSIAIFGSKKNMPSICNCCRGVIYSHHGYTFRREIE